ncbi:hypothetical protein VW23_019840 [Devosia insulae DS-56]|uniref:Uncharacterized protein n=1 Tax=Devosia insulae DS-56 TaxID=1116389 RepID=A0A1E5XQ38_9HYPH|nr:hypothetical protein [Devosia insulae]OEO30722.1 hypothetical protein VW23_019840 [Devosia insulae DS-56]
MHNQLFHVTAGLSLCLAMIEPAAAEVASTVGCAAQSDDLASIDVLDDFPLDPGGKASDWPRSLRMTYLDAQGRYVTVYHDPDWQRRLRLASCPL